MAPFLNAKGQPVKMSFFDLFAPTKPPHMESETPKKEEKPTETSPTSTAATEASADSTKITEPASSKWTRIQELALLGMQAQHMNWKEINKMLPGKDLKDIKRKYIKLYTDAPAESKPKEAEKKQEEPKKEAEGNKEGNKEEKKEEKKEETKSGEVKAAEESKKESGKGKKDGKEGNKGKKGQKGKAITEEAKPEEGKAEEGKAEEIKPEAKKGSLKARATAGENGKGGDLKSVHGHPVIFVDDDDELEFEELLYLYGLNARYDEQKWMTVDSKFFDRFGKRLGAEKLKEKLASTW